MAERLRYAINNCKSIDMDNYMLSRNAGNGDGSDTDYWSESKSKMSLTYPNLLASPVHLNATVTDEDQSSRSWAPVSSIA